MKLALACALAATLLGAETGSVSTAIAAPGQRAHPGAVVRVEHRDPHALPSRGPTNALVTIELFYTPGPSSRHQAVRLLERLQAAHPTRIRLVYRLVKGSTARFHYAALHAYSEGKFFEFMDAINAAPRSLDDKALLELGKKIGLDPERLGSAITRPPAAYDVLLEANERRRRQKFRDNPSLPNALFNGRASATQLSSLTASELETEYSTAKDLAEDLMDQGIDRRELAAAFDQIVQVPDEIIVVPGPTDEELEDMSSDPVLARQPLSYTGLPSHGPAESPLTIAVLCSPTSTNCNAPLATAQRVADTFPEQVRVVWAPYFDVGREDATDLSLLADAAFCSERDGGRSFDRDDTWDARDSPGWRWVKEVLAQSSGRTRLTTDQLIDRVGATEGRAARVCHVSRAARRFRDRLDRDRPPGRRQIDTGHARQRPCLRTDQRLATAADARRGGARPRDPRTVVDEAHPSRSEGTRSLTLRSTACYPKREWS
jgi:hypothetical protein